MSPCDRATNFLLKKREKGGIKLSSFFIPGKKDEAMSPSPGKTPQRPDLSPWYKLNRALASAKDTGSIFSHTMSFLAAVSKIKNGLLGLVDGQRGRLVVEAAAGPVLQRAKGNKCKADEGTCGEVLKNGSPTAIADPSAEPLLKGVMEDGQRPALSCICAPLRWGDIPLGILLIDDPYPASKEGFTLAEAVASFISPPLVVARWGDEKSLNEILKTKLERAIERMDLHTESHGSLMSDIVSLVERTLIVTALKKSKNVQLTAARFLGINRNTLHKKIKELKIPVR
jgi:transcriptional regulator with GAF, ATPase, and Fis domain